MAKKFDKMHLMDIYMLHLFLACIRKRKFSYRICFINIEFSALNSGKKKNYYVYNQGGERKIETRKSNLDTCFDNVKQSSLNHSRISIVICIIS